MSDVNPYQPSLETSHDPFAHVDGGKPLATRGDRFLGAFIDGIIQMVVIIPLAIVLGIGVAAMMGDGLATQITAQLVGGIAGIVVFFLLHGYLLSTQGRTIGKLVMKTRIVDRNTSELVPFWPLILKRYSWLWLVGFLPVINMIVPIFDSLMIFRESRACLHDDIAGTKVIKDI
ncbi:MAG: RDD family protein [Rubripirellula sp.]